MASTEEHPETARPIVVLLGPTASGKTELSLSLARELPGGGECVIADSMQIYRGMNIGTASPNHEERNSVPHHLLDIADPSEDGYSVSQWCAEAEAAITSIRSRNRWPIIVGGTNLYIRALLEGVFEGPKANPEIRAELDALSNEELRLRLETNDPEAALRIHPNDRRRTSRALEVFKLTGQRISEQQVEWSAQITPRSDALIIGLQWPVEDLNRRINSRVGQMMKDGFLDEVKELIDAGGLGSQACEAVGYRELAEAIAGTMSLEEAIEQIKIRTRRFAKQQRTWLRRFQAIPQSLWLNAKESSSENLSLASRAWIDQENS